jgi:valine--pyruvate aminotransferase
MSYEFSIFGSHLGRGSGIEALMDDLGNAMADGGDILMLGGGQPASIPAMDAVWKSRLVELSAQPGGIARALTTYDPPQGNPRFLDAVARLLGREFGWPIGPENIAVTSGGQTAFFFLFNLLAGRQADGSRKKILLPLMPEYIGYADQGVDGSLFCALPPLIERTGPHEFKYRVDFDRLVITPDMAALCVSRPTNPSGNVLTDDEILRLSDLAETHGIPLLMDNAYGAPFPGILFASATPFWKPHVILTYSLSKIGLPGARTGIVVGPPDIIRALASLNAIVGLSNPSAGQQIMLPLVESGELLALSRDVVRPFYQDRRDRALDAVHQSFGERFPWAVHRSEGALFLWFWFPGLPVSSKELYERLKRRRVLVIPGEYFFFGDADPTGAHRHECLRVSYAMEESVVRRGLAIIAEEVEKCFRAA